MLKLIFRDVVGRGRVLPCVRRGGFAIIRGMCQSSVLKSVDQLVSGELRGALHAALVNVSTKYTKFKY